MKWDQQKRQYIDSKGKPIPAAQIREWVDDYIVSNQREVDDKTAELIAGAITVSVFFEWLRRTIISMHGTAGVLAYGGEDEMDEARWAKVGDKIAGQLAYLENFEAQVLRAQIATESIAADAASLITRNANVPAGLEAVVEKRVLAALMAGENVDAAIAGALADSVGAETANVVASSVVGDITDTRMADLIWGQVGSRGRMYADAAYGTYANNEKLRESDAGVVGVAYVCLDDESSCEDCPTYDTDGEYVSMEEVTDIGSGICGGRCRCFYNFELFNVEPLEIDRGIYA